jgi:hypothetical protein
MVDAYHPPVNHFVTSEPSELLHMDTVGPAWVWSLGGKWHALVLVDDFSSYSCVYFMKSKDEAFSHARDLILRLKNEYPKGVM